MSDQQWPGQQQPQQPYEYQQQPYPQQQNYGGYQQQGYQQPYDYQQQQGYPQQQPYGYQQQGYQQQQPYGYQQGYAPAPYIVPNAFSDEIALNRKRAVIALGVMMLTLIGAGLMTTAIEELAPVLGIIAALSWVATWCFYMKSKGYSGLVGLLSIFGIIGMIVMLLMPSKYRR